MRHHQRGALSHQRSTSTTIRTTRSSKILPNSNHIQSFSSLVHEYQTENPHKYLIPKQPLISTTIPSKTLSSLFQSLLNFLSFPTITLPSTCKLLSIPIHLSLTPSLGRKVTGTLFGHRRGHVTFAIQLDPRSEPILLLELAMSTSSLVKEMSSGLVRIALECDKGLNQSGHGGRIKKLFQEPTWTLYCNGRKCGYALSRTCSEFDFHVLGMVRSVSVGTGVIPVIGDGRKCGGAGSELVYMRVRFERVVGSRDSEAFYMMNPDGTGGPELSIFLLRI